MCGAEYGGGGGGERRLLGNNDLAGTLPATLSFPNLPNLNQLCVRPAPPPHLAMWGSAAHSMGRWAGSRVLRANTGGGRDACPVGCYVGLRLRVGDALTGGAVCTQRHHRQHRGERT
jgi:hypothetical protein